MSSHRFQPLPGPVDVSRPELFHQSAHAAPEAEEPAHPGPVGKKAAQFNPPLAWYRTHTLYSCNSMMVWLIFFIFFYFSLNLLKLKWFYLGIGVPCVVCRDTFGSSDVRRGCWDREHTALKQHIWLGRLVQWWGIMGLLPKYPGKDMIIHITLYRRDELSWLSRFFLFSAVAVRGSRGEAYLSDVEGNGS